MGEVNRRLFLSATECTSACGKNDDYDMEHPVDCLGEEYLSLSKVADLCLASGVLGRPIAYTAAVLAYGPEVNLRFFIKALLLSLWEDWGWNELCFFYFVSGSRGC